MYRLFKTIRYQAEARELSRQNRGYQCKIIRRWMVTSKLARNFAHSQPKHKMHLSSLELFHNKQIISYNSFSSNNMRIRLNIWVFNNSSNNRHHTWIKVGFSRALISISLVSIHSTSRSTPLPNRWCHHSCPSLPSYPHINSIQEIQRHNSFCSNPLYRTPYFCKTSRRHIKHLAPLRLQF